MSRARLKKKDSLKIESDKESLEFTPGLALFSGSLSLQFEVNQFLITNFLVLTQYIYTYVHVTPACLNINIYQLLRSLIYGFVRTLNPLNVYSS